MKHVLLVSAGVVHPPYRGRLWLRELLDRRQDLAIDEVSSLHESSSPSLGAYRALVLYYHYPNEVLSDARLAELTRFVRDGGGVLAIHSATASYKPVRGYFDVLGGRFVGHGPVRSIEVQPSQPEDPIFAGIGPFSITDELYLHELASDIRPHFFSLHEGRPVPLVWTREVGSGRICYVGPGHRSASMQHAAVQEILRRGVSWVAGLEGLGA